MARCDMHTELKELARAWVIFGNLSESALVYPKRTGILSRRDTGNV